MPPSSFRARFAKARRHDAGTTRRFANFTTDTSLSSEENLINLSEYIETLIGEDDWCGQDIQDKNVIDLTDDEIFSELETNEDNSIEKILQRWRDSALRQEESFVRRGDSERNKRQRNQNIRDLNEAASKTQKITSFFSSTGASSSKSNSNLVIIEETMDDIMRDNIDDADDEENADEENGNNNNNTSDFLAAALRTIEDDANFSIPLSQKADHKINGMPKFEFIQRLSIKSYLNYRVKYNYGKMDASIATAAALFSKSPIKDTYRARAVREWAAYYLSHNQLRPFRRGKFVKTYTIIVNEAVQNFLRDKIRGLRPLERSPVNVMNNLNSEWLKEIPQAPSEISENTARRWMYFLGFRPKVKGKNYFVDGHEREDVVQYRGEFLGSMEALCQRCNVYKPKSTGQSQHSSAFTCECHGFMKAFINGQWKTSYKIITPGKNSDGYWTNDDLVKQLQDIDELVKYLHPDCDIVYLFDNSQNHHARRPDALWADNLNLSDGGKNTKALRDTTWNGLVQHMQTPDGKQKGIRTILSERNLWIEGLKLDCKLCKEKAPPANNLQCCARRILSQCEDFKVDKCWLEETVESLGHRLLFFPKFHCELNFIEMLWGYVKAKLRRMCTFSFSDLKRRLPELLDSIPLPFVKRASRHCLRYMNGYRIGLIGPELDYAIRKYKGHRMIPQENLQLIKDEFKKQQDEKMKLSFKSN